MPAASIHIPVLLEEVIEHLNPQPGKILVDGTLGGGGHATAFAARVLPDGQVIGVDLDPGAVERAAVKLSGLAVSTAVASYAELPELLDEMGIGAIDGVLLDLGLSSDQLADVDRGFSFDAVGELDLRFNTGQGEPAWRLLERLGETELANAIFRYGEERFSRRIARRIVERRREAPIRSATDLATLVRSCVPRSRGHGIDPATRTFQALRLAVNHELETLETALERLPDRLTIGGRFAVISFHSLEDRIVKHAFRNDRRLRVITKKPVQAGAQELARNPRSRSAKLRVAERVEGAD